MIYSIINSITKLIYNKNKRTWLSGNKMHCIAWQAYFLQSTYLISEKWNLSMCSGLINSKYIGVIIKRELKPFSLCRIQEILLYTIYDDQELLL